MSPSRQTETHSGRVGCGQQQGVSILCRRQATVRRGVFEILRLRHKGSPWVSEHQHKLEGFTEKLKQLIRFDIIGESVGETETHSAFPRALLRRLLTSCGKQETP